MHALMRSYECLLDVIRSILLIYCMLQAYLIGVQALRTYAYVCMRLSKHRCTDTYLLQICRSTCVMQRCSRLHHDMMHHIYELLLCSSVRSAQLHNALDPCSRQHQCVEGNFACRHVFLGEDGTVLLCDGKNGAQPKGGQQPK